MQFSSEGLSIVTIIKRVSGIGGAFKRAYYKGAYKDITQPVKVGGILFHEIWTISIIQ